MKTLWLFLTIAMGVIFGYYDRHHTACRTMDETLPPWMPC